MLQPPLCVPEFSQWSFPCIRVFVTGSKVRNDLCHHLGDITCHHFVLLVRCGNAFWTSQTLHLVCKETYVKAASTELKVSYSAARCVLVVVSS